MSDLLKLLDKYRTAAQTEREKGTYFEELIIDYLKNDPVQKSQYDAVWSFKEWADSQGLKANDTGVDLVARIAEDQTFCAIQCKFYDENKTIQKGDIDKFFAASSKSHFTRRLFVDTTRKEWGKNALDTLNDQNIETIRIGLETLEQSPIDWSVYAIDRKIKLAPKKQLREHQEIALEKVVAGLQTADRGKLIMACGTGKTYTSLKIAEKIAGAGKTVLYLVPSLALMSQTVREWSLDTQTPLRAFAACSDSQVGKHKASDDIAEINLHDLEYPATTDAQKLAQRVPAPFNDEDMTVVFSTYQSIKVISEAQLKHGLGAFDLIICDEAHRTTGATLANQDESHFVKVHNQDYIKGKKRLYMTATPRIFGDTVKTKANEVDAELASMDDPIKYGETLHTISFSEAVQRGLLTDYKVIVLAVDQEVANAGAQKRLADENSELILDDATKIIGCYRALSKHGIKNDLLADPHPMHRAVAFCQSIKSSKLVKDEFSAVVDEYLADQGETSDTMLQVETDHVDGTYNAKERHALLEWLKNHDDPNVCRILSNARCLSEGVDVPSLDAILFLHPRKSQIDVVQSVGRVMRLSPGKKLGYVILPVGIPAGMSADQALNDNKNYKVVWDVLNALRAHDDRFDATINKASLGVDVSSKIEIIAEAHTLPEKSKTEATGANLGKGTPADDLDPDSTGNSSSSSISAPVQTTFLDEFSKAIMARIVKKCGTRNYWTDWAGDIAKVAQTHITRIKTVVEKDATKEQAAFNAFLDEIRDDLNNSISSDDAIEMLAQHIITKPIFDALFEGYSFTQHNPVSRALQNVLDVLDEQNLEKESDSLKKFYASVKGKIGDIGDNAEAKQKIVVELYDKFFRTAFPRMTQKLGIVYTPVEVVDFIIHSINDILKSEFGQTLGSKGVHIIDPFTGTGTFITRLLQSGLIPKEELAHKFEHEIHANEIVLLAYYIAAINIEQVYHGLSGGDYKPFDGICLTDTFQLYEKGDMVSELLVDNSARRIKQKELDIKVIMGNPPYSAGQTSANDNNANVEYPILDETIRSTYAVHSKATSTKNLMDSYIRAIRWGSDRLGKSGSGVMGFVSGSGFIEKPAMDGMRKCLADEFSNLYVINLRGDIRKNMLSKGRAKEGENVFGSGSMTGISITFFVKNPNVKEHGQIYYHDIGDNLKGDLKRTLIKSFKSIDGISQKNGWLPISPDKHNDWLNQRDNSFDDFLVIGDKKDKNNITLFSNFSLGVATGRDAWCFNFSQKRIEDNIKTMLVCYEEQRKYFSSLSREKQNSPIKDLVIIDTEKISWNATLLENIKRNKEIIFDEKNITKALYRPFMKEKFYFTRDLNERVYQMPHIFPVNGIVNRVITVSGVGNRSGFSALMTDLIPSLDTIEKGQCYPLNLYEKVEEGDKGDLFTEENSEAGYRTKDGITDAGLDHFKTAYPNEKISKEDLFYYIYGLLHSEDYRSRYADNLSKQLPRIPPVKKASDFWAFSQAGRDLADLHINYETVEPYQVGFKEGALLHANFTDADYHVTKMKFGKGKGSEKDKTTVIYNNKITMTNIPLDAYDYIVNGKSALDWVMERQVVKTDKASGIINDANLYATETVGDAKYPLELFQRVITVSLETIKIVKALPRLDIEVKEE